MSKSKKCGVSGCDSDEVKDTDLKFLKVPICGSRRYKLWWKTLFGSAYLFSGGTKHENYICSKHFLQHDVHYLNPILHLNNIPQPKVGQEVDLHLERRRLFILLNNALLEWARRFDSFAPSAIPKSKFISTGLKIQKMLGLQTITFDDFWWKNFRITHLFSVDRNYSHKTTNLEQILRELDPNVKLYPENNESALNANPIEISQKVLRRPTRRIRRKRLANNSNDNEGEGTKNIDRYSYSIPLEGINEGIDKMLLKPKEELQIFPPNNIDTLQPSIDKNISLSISEISEEEKTDYNDPNKYNHNLEKKVLDTHREIICPSKKHKETDRYKSPTKNSIAIKTIHKKISSTKNVNLLIKDESKALQNMHAILMPPRTNNENELKDPSDDFMPNRSLFNPANLRTYSNNRKKKLNTNCENPAVPQKPSGSENAFEPSTLTLKNDSSINSENVSDDIKKEPCEELETNGMTANVNLLNKEAIPMLEIKSEHNEHHNTNDNADVPIDIPTVPQCASDDAPVGEGSEIQIKSYSEALKHIKPLEDYVLFTQNYRLIDLVWCLEQHLECCAKSQESSE